MIIFYVKVMLIVMVVWDLDNIFGPPHAELFLRIKLLFFAATRLMGVGGIFFHLIMNDSFVHVFVHTK